MNEKSTALRPPPWRLIFESAALGVGFFLIHRHSLIEDSLNYDEIYSWTLDSGTWGALFQSVLNDTQQFLYFGALKLCTFAFPANNDYWIRIPSLIFGAAACMVVYWHARLRVSEKMAGLTAALLLINPLWGGIATYCRPYALLALLISINLSLIHSWLDDQNQNPHQTMREWGILITSGLIGFTHYIGLFYLFGALTALRITGVRAGQWLHGPARIAWIGVSATLLVGCLIHQWQYRPFISWVYDSGYSCPSSMSLALGCPLLLLGVGANIAHFKH